MLIWVLHRNINHLDRNYVPEDNPFDCAAGQSFASSGAYTIRWCAMREEFTSNSFLAVTIAGVVLLCSGLVALAFT